MGEFKNISNQINASTFTVNNSIVNNSSTVKINPGRAINCKLCKDFVVAEKITSTVTNLDYNCIILSGVEVSCKSSNLIYLLSCNNCKLQYVGQTAQPLHKRANGHPSGKLGQTGCKLLTEHMNSYPCSGYGFSVQVLQIFLGTGRMDSNEVDPSQTSDRVSVEENWMVKLRTVYPYGLNDRCKGKYWTDKPEEVYTARSLFVKLDRSTNNPPVRCLKSHRNALPINICLSELENACLCPQNSNVEDPKPCAPCILNFARVTIPRLTKPIAKKLGNLILENIFQRESILPKQFYETILDMINSKFATKSQQKPSVKKSIPRVLLKVDFSDKHVQDLNISKILRNSEILKSIPPEFGYRKPPVIIYKHTPTIRNKIFNYTKETIEFSSEDFNLKEQNNENTCNCQNSQYKDPYHQHIITGDLSLIENDSLRWLLKQGPNFREQKSKSNFRRIWKNVKSGVNSCIEQWAQFEKKPIGMLSEWKTKLLDKLKTSYKNVKANPRKNNFEILKDEKNLKDLKSLKG